jgi:triphosphoribosyl-dephospho-CoA synthase
MTTNPSIGKQYQETLASAYLRACEVDLKARKPGNVSFNGPGHGMCAAQFSDSARASVDALVAPELRLGERIYRAVAASWEAVSCNTNLGIVLLCAPVLQAMLSPLPARDLRARLIQVLNAADVNDTEWIYRAIRLAAPGGLGRSQAHDVSDTPSVSVVTAMRAAAERDRIALQYTTGFADLFDCGVPRLIEAHTRWQSDEWAAVAVFLRLLGRFPDSHIARKYGKTRACEVSAKAAQLEAQLLRCYAPQEITQCLEAVDAEFKSAGINPGTTADLTVASLVIFYLENVLSTDNRDLSLSSKAQGDRYPGRDDTQDGSVADHHAAACRTGPCRVTLQTLGVI